MEPAVVQSADQLVVALYGELKKLAHARVGQLGRNGTLQTTELVHEAYARMRRNPDHEWQGPRHFFGAAAIAMREVLIDRARARYADKRGGDWVRIEPLTIPDQSQPLSLETLMSLRTALDRLQEVAPEHAEVVNLHFFAGLPLGEVADVLGVHLSTVNRHWRAARAWLRAELDTP
jgi:RNA polymerase sigma-70 factor (ECF subfamily)